MLFNTVSVMTFCHGVFVSVLDTIASSCENVCCLIPLYGRSKGLEKVVVDGYDYDHVTPAVYVYCIFIMKCGLAQCRCSSHGLSAQQQEQPLLQKDCWLPLWWDVEIWLMCDLILVECGLWWFNVGKMPDGSLCDWDYWQWHFLVFKLCCSVSRVRVRVKVI